MCLYFTLLLVTVLININMTVIYLFWLFSLHIVSVLATHMKSNSSEAQLNSIVAAVVRMTTVRAMITIMMMMMMMLIAVLLDVRATAVMEDDDDDDDN